MGSRGRPGQRGRPSWRRAKHSACVISHNPCGSPVRWPRVGARMGQATLLSSPGGRLAGRGFRRRPLRPRSRLSAPASAVPASWKPSSSPGRVTRGIGTGDDTRVREERIVPPPPTPAPASQSDLPLLSPWDRCPQSRCAWVQVCACGCVRVRAVCRRGTPPSGTNPIPPGKLLGSCWLMEGRGAAPSLPAPLIAAPPALGHRPPWLDN